MEFEANKFLTRRDLEDFIRVKVGTDLEINRGEGHVVKGKRAELKKLGLTDLNTVFGCRVVITDSPSDVAILNKKLKKKK